MGGGTSYTDDIFAPLPVSRNYIMGAGLVILLLIGAVLYTFARSIAKPLSAINDYLKDRLTQGNPVPVEIQYRGHDEIGEILSAVRSLRESMHATILQAEAIAAGDFSRDVQLLSEDDQLGRGLSNMITTLRGVVEQADAVAQGDYSREVKLLQAGSTGPGPRQYDRALARNDHPEYRRGLAEKRSGRTQS